MDIWIAALLGIIVGMVAGVIIYWAASGDKDEREVQDLKNEAVEQFMERQQKVNTSLIDFNKNQVEINASLNNIDKKQSNAIADIQKELSVHDSILYYLSDNAKEEDAR